MLKNLLLASLLIVFGNQIVLAAPVRRITANQAYQLLQQNPSVFLLDVRTPEEFQKYRLAGAILIPIDNLLARERELPGDRPILVYCEVGHRSAQVAGYLARRGYPEVYDLQGGIWDWQLCKLPVLKGLP
jgi:rhodanese-related sulfurtransferase